MDTKRPTKKAKTEAETKSLLPGPEADEAEETANAQTQADSDVVADANDSAPSAEEAAHDVESQSTQTAQEVEDASNEAEETKAPEAETESQDLEANVLAETQSSGTNETDEESHGTQTQAESNNSEEAHDMPEQSDVASAQPILYAGVILVRNKTPKPLCLSPIQLGIYATFTIQSGEIVALPHKYARSLIMQQLFEEVEGQLFLDVTSC